MINIFTRPITSLERTHPNLVYRVPVVTAKLHLENIRQTYVHQSTRSDHPIANLISLCDKDGYGDMYEYMRVVTPHAEYVGRMLGMATEHHGVNLYSQTLTGINNTDLILTHSDYSSNDILKCISHPWTYVDYRIPDNTWRTPLGYTVWTLNIPALFKQYYLHRHTSTIANFVYANVLVPSVASVVEVSLVNRVARAVTEEAYDVDTYSHRGSTFPVLENLDQWFEHRITANSVASSLNMMPSIVEGQFKSKHLPPVYQAEHIIHLWVLFAVPLAVAVMRASRETLHRIERTNINKLTGIARSYARKPSFLSSELKTLHVENIKYLSKL